MIPNIVSKKDDAAQVAPSAPALKASYRTAAAWNLFAMMHDGGAARWNRLSESEKDVYRSAVDYAASVVRASAS